MRIRVGVQFGVRGAAVPSQLHSVARDLPVVASKANIEGYCPKVLKITTFSTGCCLIRIVSVAARRDPASGS